MSAPSTVGLSGRWIEFLPCRSVCAAGRSWHLPLSTTKRWQQQGGSASTGRASACFLCEKRRCFHQQQKESPLQSPPLRKETITWSPVNLSGRSAIMQGPGSRSETDDTFPQPQPSEHKRGKESAVKIPQQPCSSAPGKNTQWAMRSGKNGRRLLMYRLPSLSCSTPYSAFQKYSHPLNFPFPSACFSHKHQHGFFGILSDTKRRMILSGRKRTNAILKGAACICILSQWFDSLYKLFLTANTTVSFLVLNWKIDQTQIKQSGRVNKFHVFEQIS